MSKMHAERIQLLRSPWLIELGAFHLNSSGLDAGELNGVYGQFSCNLDMTEAVMTLTLPDSMKLEFNLTCAICLVGSIFCSSKKKRHLFISISYTGFNCNNHRILFSIHMLWVVAISFANRVLAQLLLWCFSKALKQQAQRQDVPHAERYEFCTKKALTFKNKLVWGEKWKVQLCGSYWLKWCFVSNRN